MLFPAISLLATAAPLPVDVPTFVEVAPIVHAKCTACHRPGAAGPFPLRTYREVAKRGPMIAWVLEDGLMPPWHPVEGHGAFKDALSLEPGQLDTLIAWIDGGMPEGDASKVSAAPEFSAGWQLGVPDLVVTMTEAFEVPASGADLYRNFAVPIPTVEDKWLTAIEVRAGAPRVLHHIVFDIDTRGRGRKLSGGDGRPGWDAMTGQGGGAVGWNDGGPLLGTTLGGWAVGQQARRLPMGLARKLPKGSDLILRSHFHPSGRVESERTEIALYFAEEAPTKQLMGLQMPPMFGSAAGIDIPEGESDFTLSDTFTLPVDALALTVGGHAHSILREMKITAQRPDEDAAPIFWIDDWDFDWQNRYEWQEPQLLPAGTVLGAELIWDNSANNPANPHSPPRRIQWGFQSTDEMGSVTVAMVAKDEADAGKLWKAIQSYKYDRLRKRSRKAARIEQMAAWRMSMGDKVRQLDRNGDGKLDPRELRGASKQLTRSADKNKDGTLSRDELVAVLGDTVLPALPGGANLGPTLTDLDGVGHIVLSPGAGGPSSEGVSAHVLIFTTVDCPIANGYAPEISKIVREHAHSPVRFFLVHVDPDVTAEAARQHATDYGYVLPVLRDADQSLARSLGVTRTPEVCVIVPGSQGTAGRGAPEDHLEDRIAYRGRIDDQYLELGKRRPEPTQRDLRDALDAVLYRSPVEVPRTEAIGCTLPVILPAKSESDRK